MMIIMMKAKKHMDEQLGRGPTSYDVKQGQFLS